MINQTNKKVYLFYFVLVMGACISFVFTNISYDAEYQLAMAYRMIKGDEMVTQMWEPHQTSAFLCAILMKIYLMVTGTTTGIVLYTQVAGLLIRTAISIWLYKTIKETSGETPAIIAGVIYLLISPKELLTPEFGNMQLWFGTLMFLTLLKYLKCKKIVYLIWSAVCLCLGVFSYPSFIIAYIAVWVILLRYGDEFKKDILIFTGICVIIGGAFVLYLLLNVEIETILKCLQSALAVEPTHTVNMFQKVWAHIENVAKVLGMLSGTALIGFFVEFIYSKIRHKKSGEKKGISWNRGILISWYILMFFLLLNILSVENRGGYGLPFLAMIGLGFRKRNLLTVDEKRMYDSALWVSFMSLLATLILSDNAFLQAITYMLIAICVSTIPLYHWFVELRVETVLRKGYCLGVHIFLGLIILRCIYIHIPIYGRGQICSILDDLALIRSGPAIGIITDEAGAARQRDSMQEWKEYIQAGDTIWILGEPVDTLGYLYEDVEVGAPTVMSTPTYNSELLYYWELNPDKYPDVVILSASFGELAWELSMNEWLMRWLEEEYRAETVIDGNYWRYYFRNR